MTTIKNKNILVTFSVFIVINCLIPVYSFSQHAAETVIRTLENREREAILKSDTIELSKLMSRKIVVQNPENIIVGYRQIVDRIKGGKINYASFERQIDSIAFLNGIAVVMGVETIISQGNTQNSGKTVKRRFTNIWIIEKNTWKLTARQATNISVD